MASFFQVGNVMAFLNGIYESDVTFAELSKQGDFGLGTFNGVDGEMVAVDGVFYRIDEQGRAEVASQTLCTPFSVVSHFKSPMLTFTLDNIDTMADISKVIDERLPTLNAFYMIRLDGGFEQVQLRSEACQPKPNKPLAETLPKVQNKFSLAKSTGTMVVSRCPSYSVGCTIPGYHYHYIDEAKSTGGHVFDFKLKSATVSVVLLREFVMWIQDSKAFDDINLDMDVFEALKQVE
jgi:acetolactate decarboxylase